MIICAACGTQNRDDTRFCVDCGAFLEWEGTPAAPAPTVPATSAGKATPANPIAAGGAGVSATAGPAAAAPAAVAGQEASADTPTADPAPVVAPAPVQPGEAPRRRSAPPPPVDDRRAPLPGELVCPNCGSGNERGRRFCRSCGATLLAQAEAVRLPWWRRLFRRRGYAAGERRRRHDHRMPRRLLAMVAALCLVAVAVAARPLIIRGINNLKDVTSAHVPIRPDGFDASSFLREASPANVSDGATNRYWAPQGQAVGSWVEASFIRPVRLLDIVVTPGVGADEQQFLKHARPHELAVVATAKNGAATTKTLTLRDEPGPQHFTYEAHDTIRVRFIVRSTYGPGGTPSVAIGELEFFGRN